MKNGGAMLSFELKGGLNAGKRLMNRVQICKLVTSLGTRRHAGAASCQYDACECAGRAQTGQRHHRRTGAHVWAWKM